MAIGIVLLAMRHIDRHVSRDAMDLDEVGVFTLNLWQRCQGEKGQQQ